MLGRALSEEIVIFGIMRKLELYFNSNNVEFNVVA